MKITIKPPRDGVPFKEIAIGDFFCYNTNVFYKKADKKGVFIINIHHKDSCHYNYGDVIMFDDPELFVNRVEAEITIIK